MTDPTFGSQRCAKQTILEKELAEQGIKSFKKNVTSNWLTRFNGYKIFWQLRSATTAEAAAAVQVIGIDALGNFLCTNNSPFGVSSKKVRQPKKHLTSNCLPPIKGKNNVKKLPLNKLKNALRSWENYKKEKMHRTK